MIRGKIMLLALLLTGVIAVALGIVQMWWQPIGWEIFTKSLITLVVAGILISFLIAIGYDLPGSRGKIFLGMLVLLAIACGGLIITQLWWHVLKLALFGKVIATIAIMAVLLSFIMAVSEDFGTNKKLKDQKYID